MKIKNTTGPYVLYTSSICQESWTGYNQQHRGCKTMNHWSSNRGLDAPGRLKTMSSMEKTRVRRITLIFNKVFLVSSLLTILLCKGLLCTDLLFQ